MLTNTCIFRICHYDSLVGFLEFSECHTWGNELDGQTESHIRIWERWDRGLWSVGGEGLLLRGCDRRGSKQREYRLPFCLAERGHERVRDGASC